MLIVLHVIFQMQHFLLVRLNLLLTGFLAVLCEHDFENCHFQGSVEYWAQLY
jgi:hypothetical protein